VLRLRFLTGVIAVVGALALPTTASATNCAFSFSPSGTLVRPGASLPAGTVGKAYGPVTITVSGGTPPYSWTIDAGDLRGLTWNVTSSAAHPGDKDQVVISGTPTRSGAGGSADIGFIVFDKTGCVGQNERWWNLATGVAPKNTGPPFISGTPTPGSTLTCNDGAWTNDPNFTSTPGYGWFLDGQGAVIATGKDYTVPAQVLGHSLSCHVTYTNPFGEDTGVSGAVNVVCPTCAVLKVTQSSPTAEPAAGAPLEFLVKVTNVGAATATGVVLTDQPGGDSVLKQGLISSTRADCSVAATNTVTCPIGDLAPGASVTMALAVYPRRVEPVATVVNEAKATASNAATDDSVLNVPVRPPALSLVDLRFVHGAEDLFGVGSNDPAFALGQQVVVIVTVKNTGGRLPPTTLVVHPDNTDNGLHAVEGWDAGETRSFTITLRAVRATKEGACRFTILGSGLTSELTQRFNVPIVNATDPAAVHVTPSDVSGGLGPPATPHIDAPTLPPYEIQGAIQQGTTSLLMAGDHRTTCRWLANTSVRFKRTATTKGKCTQPIWLKARSLRHWSLRLRHRLPPGRYTIYIRVVDKRGAYDPVFTARRHNTFTLTVR
jgi:uncharacterized repeat protein (TIGR01451 family)